MLDEAKPFWKGIESGKLMIQRCRTCHQLNFYPREYCKHDLGDLAYEEVEGKGRILSYTVVYRAANPDLNQLTPYVGALVEIEPNVQLFGRVINTSTEELLFDKEVRVVFEKQMDQNMLMFELV